MKKQLLSVWLLILLLFPTLSLTSCRSAQKQQAEVGPAAEVETIHHLTIDVELQKNGDAVFTEIWDMTLLQGTEWYLKLYQLGEGSEVKSLAVQDETGKMYRTVSNWDVEENLEGKKNRCGILLWEGGDYEVCWGIGEYGRHRYTAQYTITNFIKSYTDFDGFNYSFVNDGSTLTIQQVDLTIDAPKNILQPDKTNFWGYGYTGETSWHNDTIEAHTSIPLLADDSFKAIVQFDKELFHPSSKINESLDSLIDAHFTQGTRSDGQGGPVTTAMGKEMVHSVTIDVVLDTGGQATITEVWDVTTLRGTEWYLRFDDSRNLQPTNISILDETGASYTEDSFSRNRGGTLTEKTGLYDVEKLEEEEAGYELWWGIGSYGRHQYTVTYSLWNFVNHYQDYSGFAYSFLSGPPEVFPIEKVHLSIEKEDSYFDNIPITSSNTFYWGEKFEGTVWLEDGKIKAESNAPQAVNNSFVLVARFDNAMFDGWASTTEDTFDTLCIDALSDVRFIYEETGSGLVQVTGDAGLADVHDVTILVEPQESGDIRITETWDITPYSGTEWYTEIPHISVEDIRDVSIHDETGQPFVVGNETVEEGNKFYWRTQKTREEKTNLCGYSYSQGPNSALRISWGISALAVRHQYTVQYTLPNQIKGTSEADTLLLRFLTYHPTASIARATVTVKNNGTVLDAQNTNMGAYGYNGTLFFENGNIVASTRQPLLPEENISLHLAFSPSLFNISTSTEFDDSFIPEQYKLEPFFTSNTGDGGYITTQEIVRSSSYSPRKSTLMATLFVAAMVIVCLFPVWISSIIGFLRKRKIAKYYKSKNFGINKAHKNSYLKQMDYCRTIPYQGNLSASIWTLQILQLPPKDSDIISSFVMRWAHNGIVQFVGESSHQASTLEAQQIAFVANPPVNVEYMEPLEHQLYTILKSASGKDQLLASKELDVWAKDKENARTIIAWKRSIHSSCMQSAEQRQAVEKFTFATRTPKYGLADAGIAEAKNLLGLKHYLLDFTLVHERMPPEVHLWKEYLVYASLFGIADEVEKAFSNLYPQYFPIPSSTTSSTASYQVVRNLSRTTSHTFDSTAKRITGSASGISRSSGGGGGSRSRSSSRGGRSSSGGGGRGGGRR